MIPSQTEKPLPVIAQVTAWRKGRDMRGAVTLDVGSRKIMIWEVDGECAVIFRRRNPMNGTFIFEHWRLIKGALKEVVKAVKEKLRIGEKQLHLAL